MHALFLALIPWFAPAFVIAQGQAGSADERYSYAAGLFEKGMSEMAAKENAAFLKDFPNHPKASMARYRLALALFDLKKLAEAAPELQKLAQLGKDFTYWREVALRRGQCSYEGGRYDEAAEAFDLVLSDPDHALAQPARYYRAECDFRRGLLEEASPVYAALLAADANGEYARPALYGLAWCRFKLKDYSGAAYYLDQFLERHQNDPARDEVRYLRGECALNLSQPKEALKLFATVRDGDYADDALLGQAYATSALGDEAKAAALFRSVGERYPDSPLAKEASLQAGVHSLRAGEVEQASEVLERLSSGAPGGDQSEALFWLGTAQTKAKKYDEAAATLARARESCKDEALKARIQIALGDAHFDAGRFADAARAYQQVRSGEQADYALQAAALAWLNAGDQRAALVACQEFDRQFASSPLHVEALAIAGEAHFQLKAYDQAEAMFTRALAADREQKHAARCRSRLGWCRYLSGDFAAARTYFAELVEQFPDDALAPEASLLASQCAVNAGELEAARALLERHVTKYRSSAVYGDGLLQLARTRKMLGDLAGAEQALGRLMSDDPQTALKDRALFLLAEVQEAKKEPAAAAATYAKLVAEVPSSSLVAAALYGRAWCLKEAGQTEEALACARELIQRKDQGELKPQALELSATLARQAKQPEVAVEASNLYAREFRDRKEAGDVALVAALALEESGQDAQAAAFLDGMRKQVGADSAARLSFELGLVLRKTGDLSGSDKALKAAESTAGDPALVANAAFEQGETAFANKDFKVAQSCYERALRQSANDAELTVKAHYKLGWTALEAKDEEAAASHFASVVEAAPQHALAAESSFLAGEACYRHKDYAQAASYLERARKDYPKSESAANVSFRLGQCLFELNRAEECVAVLEDLKKRHADFKNGSEADLVLGQALAKLNKNRSARQVLTRVVEQDKGVLAARARLALGRLALAEGDRENALAEFLKVAILYAHDDEVAEALFHAGCVLEDSGDKAKATQQFRELVTRFPKNAYASEAQKHLRSLASE